MDEKERFLKSFEQKLKSNVDQETFSKLSNQLTGEEDDTKTADYYEFRKENLPQTSTWYERLCQTSEKLLKVAPDKKTAEKFSQHLYNSHLNATPMGVQSASLLLSLSLVMLGMLLLVVLSVTIGTGIVLTGLGSYFAMQYVPLLLAKRTKAKANDQIIIAIFYIVAFMRFNSNFERAVSFAANYLSPPLSLDFKRILWQLENAEYPSIKAAFDEYLEDWREENLEFLESIYLIESSLYESEEFRRISLLDKSLDTILQGNYEKMLHFAQELRNKVATFNMIGVVLPILGLIILPLAASFGDPRGTWEIVVLLYNVLFPVFVAYFAFLIIFNRPSAANSVNPPKDTKENRKLQQVPVKVLNKTYYLSAKIPSLFIFFLFLFIGLSPLIIHVSGLDQTMNAALSNIFGNNSPFGTFQEFRQIDGTTSYNYGPYGVLPGIISLFFPLAFAFGIGYYLRWRYKNLINMRKKTKELEEQFPSATFQLGNRINEGISAELAFGNVAETMKGTEAGVFFSKIDTNIKFNGMSVERAVFDEEEGAINQYPSDLITSSMKIFIRSVSQGPEIAAKTLIDLSKYLSEIHMSNERMQDLLAESLGSMKSQASFLAPVISGVVISIVSLVTLILSTLAEAAGGIANDADATSASANVGSFLGESIPTYLFQISVGMYMVVLIIILMYMISNLEGNNDSVTLKYQIAQRLIRSMTLYGFIVTIGVLGFAFIGTKILGSVAVG